LRLRILESIEFCVGSVDRKGETVVDQLESVGSHRPSDIRGMGTLLEQAAENPLGPTQWPSELTHLADKDNKIYQFIKGDLRVLYFFDADKILICAAATLKQGKKTNPKAVASAVAARDEYFQAKASGDVVWLKDEEEG